MPKTSWSGRSVGSAEPSDVHSRARRGVSPSGGIVRGKFPSRKNARMVYHDGLLTLDAMYLFETSPLIRAYREKPLSIRYPDGARLRRYTPAFEVELRNRDTILVDVRPLRSIAQPEARHRLECVQAHLQRSGVPFVVLTEESLHIEPRLSALKWLYHQGAGRPPSAHAAAVAAATLVSSLPASMRATVALLAPTGVDLFSLLVSGLLTCSLDTPMSLSTSIQFPEEIDHVWFHVSQKHGF